VVGRSRSVISKLLSAGKTPNPFRRFKTKTVNNIAVGVILSCIFFFILFLKNMSSEKSAEIGAGGTA